MKKTSLATFLYGFTERALPYLALTVFVVTGSLGTFSGGLWGGVGIGFGILAFAGTAYLNHAWPKMSRDFFYLALLSLAISALLNVGSFDSGASWYDWTRLVTIFLPLVLLSAPEIAARTDHKHLFNLLTIAMLLSAFALGIELFLDAPVLHLSRGDHIGLTHYNRGLSYAVILAMPVMAFLWTRPLPSPGGPEPRHDRRQMALPISFPDRRGTVKDRRLKTRLRKIRKLPADRWMPFALFILLMLFPTSMSESRAAKLAFILAMAVVAAAKTAPRLTRHGLLGLVIILLGWPFYAQQAFLYFQDKLAHLPPSWRARVEIWDYMSYRVFEHPWLGWGLGTSKLLDFKNPHGDLYTLVATNAPHPHNVVTQLWVELGLPGLLFGVAFGWLTLRQASRLPPQLAPFAMGAWMAALCLALVAYNFWTDSMFAAFAMTGFAFGLLAQRMKKLPSF